MAKDGESMEKLRYNRTFKNGIAVIVFCVLLFGCLTVCTVVAKIQYDSLVSDMKSVDATIVDIDLDVHVKAPDEQEIYIEYIVDGITYNRELKTDTAVSFSAGVGAHYSVGDRVQIFYDPQNPEIIASPRSISVGILYFIIGSAGLALILFVLYIMLKNHRHYLVTQEEYEKEKEERKKTKAEKKQLKLEKRKKYAKLIRIGKIILIILGVILGLFILYILFGLLLISLGY